jgi:hypothetical protein
MAASSLGNTPGGVNEAPGRLRVHPHASAASVAPGRRAEERDDRMKQFIAALVLILAAAGGWSTALAL